MFQEKNSIKYDNSTTYRYSVLTLGEWPSSNSSSDSIMASSMAILAMKELKDIEEEKNNEVW